MRKDWFPLFWKCLNLHELDKWDVLSPSILFYNPESLWCDKKIAIGDPLDSFYSGEVVETIKEQGSDYSDGLYYQVVLVCKVLSGREYCEYDELVISSSEVKKLELQ